MDWMEEESKMWGCGCVEREVRRLRSLNVLVPMDQRACSLKHCSSRVRDRRIGHQFGTSPNSNEDGAIGTEGNWKFSK